jgi:hypothetical protein
MGVSLVVPWLTLSSMADGGGMGAAEIARVAALEQVMLGRQGLILEVDGDARDPAQWTPGFVSRGTIFSPVTELALGAGCLQALELWWVGSLPPGTSVDWTLRTGRTAIPDRSAWTPWIRVPVRSGEVMRVAPVVGRYVQWRAVLSTRRRTVSPQIVRVRLRAIAAEELCGEVR